MAINIPTNFGENYAKAASAGGSSAIQDYIKEFYPTPEESFQQDLFNSVNTNIDPVLSAWGTEVDNWANIDFEDISNPATAFMQFKSDILSEGGRKSRYAKKNNLLNPVAYVQKYNEQMKTMAPQLAEKLVNYQLENKLSMKEMQNIVAANPGLTRVLKQFGGVKQGVDPATGIVNPVWEMMHPEPTLGQSWGKFATEVWEGGKSLAKPENALFYGPMAAAAYGGYQAYKDAPWVKKAADVVKKGRDPVLKMIAPYAANKTVGQITKAGLKASGVDDKVAAAGQEVTEGVMSVVQAKISKHGVAKVLGKVAKSLGWKAAAKTIGKFSAGALGAGATYGIGTAVMYTWLAKDLYDVYNIVKNMD